MVILEAIYIEKRERIPVSLLNCSPKAITGRAEAKNKYAVGASMLKSIKKEQKAEGEQKYNQPLLEIFKKLQILRPNFFTICKSKNPYLAPELQASIQSLL